MTATKKDDVLLPQDAQAVDPSQLSALTPEVVSWSNIGQLMMHVSSALSRPVRWPEGAWNGLWGHHMRLEGDVGGRREVPGDGGQNDG